MTQPALENLEKVGIGLKRPEDVAIDAAGRVFASDQLSAVAELKGDGSLVRYGDAGGRPNGINLDLEGRMVIANMGLGCVQAVDFATNSTTVLVDRVGEQRLLNCNYPLVDSQGRIWISCCSRQDNLIKVMATCDPDGFIVRLDPDGHVEIAAGRVRFPNCMALDAGETHLYVARTTSCDVVRFEIRADGSLGAEEPYGPRLGTRDPDQCGPQYLDDIHEYTRQWGLADGIAFDAEANLWVTIISQDRILAITPELELIEVISGLVHPTSLAWGGADMRDVYIGSTVADHLVKARSSVPGLPTVAQARGIVV